MSVATHTHLKQRKKSSEASSVHTLPAVLILWGHNTLVSLPATHLMCCSVCFTFHRTEAPSFIPVIARSGGAPVKVVLPALSGTLRIPFVVVIEGKNAGHSIGISQQSVYICK